MDGATGPKPLTSTKERRGVLMKRRTKRRTTDVKSTESARLPADVQLVPDRFFNQSVSEQKI